MKKTLTMFMAGLFLVAGAGFAQADFVGNKLSKTFHTESCPIVKQMKSDNKVVFKMAAEAVTAGYTACQKCAPADLVFAGNKSSMTYHKADCRLVASIKTENKVDLKSADAAVKAGYKPCSICLGEKKDKK
ncbi:MAG: Ada metal-binding domain-containing protein [Candidatus Omnitrophota bacterium]